MRSAVPILLLALAAPLPARAAERPAASDAAVACPRHGPGFVEVPGTGTCIRIGGRVRAEAGTASSRAARRDVSTLRSQGRLSVDTRTETAYGPLRTFVRMRADQGDGRPAYRPGP